MRELASARTGDFIAAEKCEAGQQGEGNREADRRYRRGVRETVEEIDEEERARRARELTPEEQEAARRAEEVGKARKRPASSDREI